MCRAYFVGSFVALGLQVHAHSVQAAGMRVVRQLTAAGSRQQADMARRALSCPGKNGRGTETSQLPQRRGHACTQMCAKLSFQHCRRHCIYGSLNNCWRGCVVCVSCLLQMKFSCACTASWCTLASLRHAACCPTRTGLAAVSCSSLWQMAAHR